MEILEPHLWAALVFAVLAIGTFLWARWRYYR